MDDTPLRVLLLAGRFEVRGTSAYTLRLARHLREHGIEPVVVTPDASILDPGTRIDLPLREYPSLHLPGWGRFVLQNVVHDCRTDPPDLIHVQSRGLLPLGMRLARRLDRPLVVTLHDLSRTHERIRIDRGRPARFLAVSESVKYDLLAQLDVSPRDITVIHSGVDPLTEIRTLPVLDPGHVPVVGTAAPLEPIKGLHYFLGAAQRVVAAGRNVEFLVSGSGPEEFNLRRMTRELGLVETVTFAAGMHDFRTSLAATDVFCLTSLSQGIGTIMLEAMSLAKPVIATGVGGVYSVIRDGETGFVVPPSDSAALAERILALLDDPARARAVGEAGRELVHQQFGVGRMVERTAQVYREVLAARTAPAPAAG